MPALLALDLGTTNLKAAAFSTDGVALARESCPTPVDHSRAGWAEHDPFELWRAASELLRRVTGQLGAGERIVGIGLASMGEAGTLFDSQRRPLFPIIAWFDRRTEPQAIRLLDEVGRHDIFRITGQSVSTNFSLTRLMWLHEHEPDVFARATGWMCVPDWIRFKLCGEVATDFTIASRTMAFDQTRRDWSDALLARLGFGRELFARAVPSSAVVGQVTREASDATGIPVGVPVIAGGHDHLVAAFGAGVAEPGRVLDSTGTAESILTVLDAPMLTDAVSEAGYATYCHVARGHYVLVGGLRSSGGMIEWLIEQFGERERASATPSASVYDALLAEMSGAPGANGVLVVPDFSGAGTPAKNPLTRGAILGMTLGHTKGDIAQAMIEAATFWLRGNLEFFGAELGHAIERVRVVGGATKNAFWLRTKADASGRVIEAPQLHDVASGDAALRGAAMLAGLGAGVFADEADAMARMPLTWREIPPDVERAGRYAALYPAWQRACQAARAAVSPHRAPP